MSTVHAQVSVTLAFTAVGFSGGGSAPADSVSGTIVYDPTGLGSTDTINSPTSVSLTIAGHNHTLDNMGFTSPWFGNTEIIYGSPFAEGLDLRTDDFWLIFDRVAGTGSDLTYWRSSTPGASFNTGTFASCSLTQGAVVPEPTGAAGLRIAAFVGLNLSAAHARKPSFGTAGPQRIRTRGRRKCVRYSDTCDLAVPDCVTLDRKDYCLPAMPAVELFYPGNTAGGR